MLGDIRRRLRGGALPDRVQEEIELERAAVLALLTAGYAAWAILSILYLQFDNGVAGLWLPNVFAVASCSGIRGCACPRLPRAVFVASTLANRLLGTGFELCALYSLANTISVVAGAMLIGRVCGDRRSIISGARDYSIMLLLGGMVAPSLAAALFSTLVAQSLDWQPIQTFWRWVAGEGLGFAVLFPVLMMMSRASLAGLLGARRLAQLVATIGASTLFALAAASWTQFPLLLVIVPLMLAAAFLAPLDMAVACGAVGATLIGLVAAGTLPGLDPSNGGFAFGFQLAVGIVVVLPLLGALIIEQTRVDRRRIAESEQRFRRAMEDSAIGVVVVGLDGRIIESNPAFAAMLGYARHELETLTFFQITHPDDMALGAETMARVRAGLSDSYHFEKRYLHKDGTPVWTRLSGSVIRDSETGAPLYLVSQIEDIDARKKSEAAIEEAERAGALLWRAPARGFGISTSSAARATIRRSGSRCWAMARTSSTPIRICGCRWSTPTTAMPSPPPTGRISAARCRSSKPNSACATSRATGSGCSTAARCSSVTPTAMPSGRSERTPTSPASSRRRKG